MPLYRKIDEELGLVIISGIGSVTSTDAMELALTFDDETGAENTYRRVIDLRQAELNIPTTDVDDVSKLTTWQEGIKNTERIAILTNPGILPAVKTFINQLLANGIEIAEFHEMTQALDWLNGR